MFFRKSSVSFFVIISTLNHLPRLSSVWSFAGYIKDILCTVRRDTEPEGCIDFSDKWNGNPSYVYCYPGGSQVGDREGYGRRWSTKNKRLTASATRCAGGRAACKCPLFSRGSARPATLACKGLGWRGWCGVVRWAVDRSGCPWEAAKAEDEGWAAKGEVVKVWVFSEGGVGPAAGAGNGNTVLTSEWAGTA